MIRATRSQLSPIQGQAKHLHLLCMPFKHGRLRAHALAGHRNGARHVAQAKLIDIPTLGAHTHEVTVDGHGDGGQGGFEGDGQEDLSGDEAVGFASLVT